MVFKLGIDEAGRGPVLGPLVIAGCLVDEKHEKKLKKLGVKDSKKLTRKKREELEIQIKEIAETFEIIRVYPNEIDASSISGVNLNDLEAHTASEIINRINRGFAEISVVIDCPSPNREAYNNLVKSKILELASLREVSSEHKADVNHISASAASILAKCVRDREMDLLKEKYGEVGSGYCHDPITIKFIKENLKKLKDDVIFRKTWQTWQTAVAESEQKTLFE